MQDEEVAIWVCQFGIERGDAGSVVGAGVGDEFIGIDEEHPIEMDIGDGGVTDERLLENIHFSGLVVADDGIVDGEDQGIGVIFAEGVDFRGGCIGAAIVEQAESAKAERVVMFEILGDDVGLVFDHHDQPGLG